MSPSHLIEVSPRYTRLAACVAMAMLPLFLALAMDTRHFQGINVWVKPLKFHGALVVYLITLAAFAQFASSEVTSRPWWRWHERAVVLAVVLELIWIGTAASLGVASHFNESTPLWASMYSLMGIGAIVLTSASTTLAWAIYRHPAGDLSPVVRVGLVLGLSLTFPLTLVTAGTLADMGSHWIGGTASDADGLFLMGWSLDGGDLRVAHFFATHAMHALPLAGVVCAKVFGNRSLAPIFFTAVMYVGFVAVVFVQALMGQPFIEG